MTIWVAATGNWRRIINQAEALVEQRINAPRFDLPGRDERDASHYAPGPDDAGEAIDFHVLVGTSCSGRDVPGQGTP